MLRLLVGEPLDQRDELDEPGADIAQKTIHLQCGPDIFSVHYSERVELHALLLSILSTALSVVYLAAMNRSHVSGCLPETDLSRLRWREVRNWVTRIPTLRVREAVKRNLEKMRRQNAEA